MRTDKSSVSFAPYVSLLFVCIFMLLIFILPASRLMAAPPIQADPVLPPVPTQPKAPPIGMTTPTPVATKKTDAMATPVCVGMPLPTVTATQPTPLASDAGQSVSFRLPIPAERSSEDIQKAVAACIPVMRVSASSAAERVPDAFPTFEDVPDKEAQEKPYSWVVHVITKFKDTPDKVYHCTGFLLSWRTVGTSAHCVFRARNQTQQDEVEYVVVIVLGIGSEGILAKSRHTWRAWTVYEDYGWDVALLDLGGASDNKITRTDKFLWADEDSTDILLTKRFEVAGYPCAANECIALRRAEGNFDEVGNSRNQAPTILYAQGTSYKGQSGSGAFHTTITTTTPATTTIYAVLSHRTKENEKIGFTRLHCGMKKLIDGLLTEKVSASAQGGSTLSAQTTPNTLNRKLYLPLIRDSCKL